MTSVASDLLRLLGARATPGLAHGPTAGTPAAGNLDFARLLDQAKAGQLQSGRQVTMAKNAGVDLSDEQIKRLSAAADLAESQGATRALVMIDGLTLRLDVGMREVTGVADLRSSSVLTGIDAVINVPGDSSHLPHTAGLPATLNNSSLLGILARNKPAA